MFKKKTNKQLYTVAFYNLENLFDTHNNNHTLDDDFTPSGFKEWTPKRYSNKLNKLARTIFEIGKDLNQHAPVLVGVAEVENNKVLKDLLNTKPLQNVDYGFVHYESPDERGIDTALLYRKKYFEVLETAPLLLMIDNIDGVRDTTRDILYVHGKLNKEEVHLFVNHWPSRRDGNDITEYKRVKAAEVVKRKMEEIELLDQNPNYIVMGDFNDDPKSLSIQTLMEDTSLFNPMEKLHLPKERGSSNYKKSWSLFDQIILSHSFFNYQKGTHSFSKANIFDDKSLKENKGKYKGSPFRTYVGKKYLGGYSDHFPVYILLKYNK
ncbi:endonuclease/exonuclease/phosphatase family protein [Maribacter sp. 2210JD10-5]|uniref:endonuclease/exonuclease/phosphatase family protein n=1 Tax=Maribacter sp. 2210JD10-5 TaxID=3386272 RepID=UPI0039BD56F9